jgi:hypothetical protein
MPVILATQEAEIRRILVRNHPEQIVFKTLSQKTLYTHTHTHTKGLMEWFKMKALSSSPNATKEEIKIMAPYPHYGVCASGQVLEFDLKA